MLGVSKAIRPIWCENRNNRIDLLRVEIDLIYTMNNQQELTNKFLNDYKVTIH